MGSADAVTMQMRLLIVVLSLITTVAGFSRMKAKKSELLHVHMPRTAYNSIVQQLSKAGCSVDNHDPRIPETAFPFKGSRFVPDDISEPIITSSVRQPYVVLRSQYYQSNVYARTMSFGSWYLEHESVSPDKCGLDGTNYSAVIGFVRASDKGRVIHNQLAHLWGFSDLELSSITKEVIMNSIFNFIFVVERLEESYDMFAATFECERAEVFHHNSGNKNPKFTDDEEMTLKVTERFNANNAKDLHLYKLVNQILDDMKANVTEGLRTYSQDYIEREREAMLVRKGVQAEAKEEEKRIRASEPVVETPVAESKGDIPTTLTNAEMMRMQASSRRPTKPRSGPAAIQAVQATPQVTQAAPQVTQRVSSHTEL